MNKLTLIAAALTLSSSAYAEFGKGNPDLYNGVESSQQTAMSGPIAMYTVQLGFSNDDLYADSWSTPAGSSYQIHYVPSIGDSLTGFENQDLYGDEHWQ